jgi:16S rRNA processing protein RimM
LPFALACKKFPLFFPPNTTTCVNPEYIQKTGELMITVGKVRDAHGLKGELFIILFAGEATWAEELKTATLVRKERVKSKDGTFQNVEKTYTFPITRFKPHKNGLIMKVDGIENRTDAEAYAGSLFQVSNEHLTSEPGEKIFLREIEGFEVFENEKVIGKIVGFSSNGAQDLIVVKSDEAEPFEIPLVPDFIENLNFKNKKILMKLPEGLVPGPQ